MTHKKIEQLEVTNREELLNGIKNNSSKLKVYYWEILDKDQNILLSSKDVTIKQDKLLVGMKFECCAEVYYIFSTDLDVVNSFSRRIKNLYQVPQGVIGKLNGCLIESIKVRAIYNMQKVIKTLTAFLGIMLAGAFQISQKGISIPIIVVTIFLYLMVNIIVRKQLIKSLNEEI